jgi:predicted ATPase with chaperone activity
MTGLDVAVAQLPELPAPASLAEAGLRLDQVLQLAVKALHFAGELTGVELAARVGLPFQAVEPVVDAIKAQRLCEIVGGTSLGAPSYRYRITHLGREHAGTFLDRNMYTGIAPVPIDQYRRYVLHHQQATRQPASRQQIRQAFSHLVLSDRVLDQLGPAINAGHSLFVYGPPGNGKTVIAQSIRNVLPGTIWIPHALDVDGSIIQLFDPVSHEPLPEPEVGVGLDSAVRYDQRWVHCRRPAVMVGGELTLAHLELTYNSDSGFYRAPVHLVANGGVLIVDDFGRQQCSPQSILNRWITPLESRVDYLTLQSGKKV